jgi:epsin
MREIAHGTSDRQSLEEIMGLIHRRFTEKSAEEWRQIFKALLLLEFLVKNGAEQVVDKARGEMGTLGQLTNFHFQSQNGKDEGAGVRAKATELIDLLRDDGRTRSERRKAAATRHKYTGVEGGRGLGGGFSGSSGGSGGGGRYGGFGSESAGYGGYAGGDVYGDGGVFGRRTNDLGSTSGSRGDAFEAYDEFDDDRRPAASAKAKRPERSAPPKKAAPVKKAPEIDLFSFDDPEPSSSTAPAAAASSGGALASLASPAHANDDDDEFDDFQSATPAAQSKAPSNAFMNLAAPKPVSAPQQANLSSMVGLSSISPAPSPATTIASPPSQQMPAAFQAPPGYFNAGMASAPMQPSAALGMAALKPASSSLSSTTPATAAKPAASGGDAFGALWNQASMGIKKTSTPTSGGATMGQLAKERSSAGIWGASSPSPSQSKPPAAGGSAMNDLLG